MTRVNPQPETRVLSAIFTTRNPGCFCRQPGLKKLEFSPQNLSFWESEIVIGMTIEALNELDTEISHQLKEAFRTRMLQRRNTDLVHLISYLSDPSQRKGKDQFGFRIEREKINLK